MKPRDDPTPSPSEEYSSLGHDRAKEAAAWSRRSQFLCASPVSTNPMKGISRSFPCGQWHTRRVDQRCPLRKAPANCGSAGQVGPGRKGVGKRQRQRFQRARRNPSRIRRRKGRGTARGSGSTVSPGVRGGNCRHQAAPGGNLLTGRARRQTSDFRRNRCQRGSVKGDRRRMAAVSPAPRIPCSAATRSESSSPFCRAVRRSSPRQPA